MPSIHKSDLVRLAESKADDAVMLLELGRHSNAYYLSGYAVELALKAIISSEFRKDTLPDRAFVGKIYVHNLQALVGLAGLTRQLEDRKRVDRAFDTNWAIVANWSEESRYDTVDSIQARAMIDAVTNERSGVLPWLRTHW